MRVLRHTSPVVAAMALVAGLLAALAAPAGAQAPTVELQILTINDFHGRLQPPVQGPPPVGGAAQLAALVNQLEGENPNTAFVSAGDNIGASTFVSAVAEDAPTIEILDAMGLDVAAVGNHEFDRGFEDLTDRVEGLADFPYLGANVYFEGGDRALTPFHVETLGGIDVGFVGVVTEETPSLVTPAGIVGLDFRDPVEEAELVAEDLKDGEAENGEADVVVLLAHEGAAQSTTSVADLENDPVFGEFVDASADIDAIVSGHTHQAYALEAPVPGGGTRPIVQAQNYGQRLGRITLSVDEATGDVVDATVELRDVVDLTPDPVIADLVQDAVDESAVLGAEVLGEITEDITRAFNPPPTPGGDPVEDRGRESTLGNLIADVQLWGTQAPGRGGAEIAFMNPGGLRADLLVAPPSGDEEPGEVTYSEAFDVQPFANDVVTQTLTGDQVRQALEEQWQPAGASRPVLWLGVSEGFTYEYDPAQPQGQRVDPMSMRLHGEPIGRFDTYRVTTNTFLAAGGDNFATLADGTDRVTTGDNDLTMLRDYLLANSPVTPDTEPRSEVVSRSYGPFRSLDQFVLQQFRDVAGRAPFPLELAAWTYAIDWRERSVEQLVVQLLNVDRGSSESSVIRLYAAFFDRPPDAGGLAYWSARLGAGWSVARVAGFFAVSAEFQRTYGSLSDDEFVELVYENVLGRAPDAGGFAYWTGQLGTGRISRGTLMARFAESAENRTRTELDLKVVDVFRSMLQRMPTTAEYREAVEAVASGQWSLEELVALVLGSSDYGDRFRGPKVPA